MLRNSSGVPSRPPAIRAVCTDTPGGDFHNVAITPDGAEAVVVGAATIQVLSLASNTVVGSYPASSGTSVAVSADGIEERTIVLAVERNTKQLEPLIHENGE